MSNKFVNLGADKDTIGFSNSRLVYDEMISKFCFAVETHADNMKRATNVEDIKTFATLTSKMADRNKI